MTPVQDLNVDMTMRELLATFPGAQSLLFQRFHLGGCSGCGFEPQEKLVDVCKRKEGGLDPQDVLRVLKEGAEQEAKLLVTVDELETLLAGEIELIDVRPPQEYNLVRLAKSKLATQELVDEILTKWPKDKAFYLIDKDGLRATDTVRRLRNVGFTGVKAVAGGLAAWSTEIDPLFPRY